MDFSEKEKFSMEKRGGDHLNYQNSNITVDWQFNNPSINIIPGNPICSSPCPSVSMVEAFAPGLWSHPSDPQSLGLCQNNVQPSLGWNSSEPVPKVPVFLQAVPGDLPPNLSHIPADSAFIERAARFSCFNGGSLGGMMSPFAGPSEWKGAAGAQMSETNVSEAHKDVSLSSDHVSQSGSPMKNDKEKGRLQIGTSSSEPGDTDVNGNSHDETSTGEPSPEGLGAAKKRKRNNQDTESDQAQGRPQLPKNIDDTENKQKAEHNNSNLASGKATGKQAKDGLSAGKEEYIHVRARRGQATNSHSLAERVRREKISERMKFLQDLVPGCSKVTGKAVMLDEIINYVQSLQRQVEFLSMKLAAVNPRLDFNIEGLLAKDLLQARAIPSSSISFSNETMHPQLHPSQQGLLHPGIPGMVNHPDVLSRAASNQFCATNGFKETAHQVPSAWEEYHNMVPMPFGTNPPVNTQELNAKPHDSFPM